MAVQAICISKSRLRCGPTSSLPYDSLSPRVRSQFFKSYVYHGADGVRNHLFGVSLVDLIDTLGVFATSDGLAELVVKWSDSDATLNFE
eukprot:8853925-Pyramimonas_sp.AAC.1